MCTLCACYLVDCMAKWQCGQHRCGYTFIPTGNRFSALNAPLSNLAQKIYIWIDKIHVVNTCNSEKIIWIFTIANWRNVDVTEKQHSRHQQFLRIPLSPLEASGRLPGSRDHLFSYSMSEASLPQGPDMWYLTFYENKVTHIPNHNLQVTPFNSKLATFVWNCGAKPRWYHLIPKW